MNSFYNVLKQASLEVPQKVAFLFTKSGTELDESVTYSELELRARAVSNRLIAEGTLQDRVILLCHPGIDFIVGYFACLRAGMIAVPCFPPTNAPLIDKLHLICQNAKPGHVLTTSSVLDTLKMQQSNLESPVALLPTDQQRTLTKINDILKLRLIVIDDSKDNDLDDKGNGVKLDDVAFLQYTSGSTQQPKGVMVTHRNLFANMQIITRECRMCQDDFSVYWLPPYHDMGLIGGILAPVFCRYTSLLMNPNSFLKYPLRWLKLLSDYKGTISSVPNFAYDYCVDRIGDDQLSELDLRGWRLAACGAEPIHTETLERFYEKFKVCGFHKNFYGPCYGMAEVVLFVSIYHQEFNHGVYQLDSASLARNQIIESVPGQIAKSLITVGIPSSDYRIEIVNPADNSICPELTVGEIWVTGESVALGYWNFPEETDRIFHAYLNTGEGPFLRTGDYGFFKDGMLFITGRMKEVIIINGHNYYPQDIELKIETSIPTLRLGSTIAFGTERNNKEELVIIAGVKLLDNDSQEQLINQIQTVVNTHFKLTVSEIKLVNSEAIKKTTSGKKRRIIIKNKYEKNEL
ncbi:fatty acyl-AMP ligase [Legionella taurinensis]|uniref:Fatty acyl-AMP ligase n=1 Tax=Legionella taurinensis TaxID=70611 RepID=A0A3A5LA99_9GAMM|nr:fatty acyl-AMP ligase [Legionella taurinensis]RJT44153.1 fatty acyl-AMP ligase [Legionella taurinensis]RJT64917.1 fatty acyl-AMP ligase [Legionella taurinensis]STY26568.1 saframycin Mx1 synthetase B [Legionella taurinensis]